MACRKLGRDNAHKKVMFREMTTQLIVNERIVTIETHVKEIRETTEKMVILGKRGDLSVKGEAAASVHNEIADIHEEKDAVVVESALQKLFSDTALHYKNCNGGYTRMYKLANPRKGDAAPIVIIELV